MKVLSYLELHKLNITSEEKYGNWIGNNFKWDKRLSDFYSQAFKPELIELFEGWEFDNSDGCYYPTKNPVEDTYIFVKGDPHEYLYGESFIGDNSSLIRTLDDFITDCQRAGIELNWKESGE